MPAGGVSWVETLVVMQADGTALTTNNTQTSIINPQAKLKLDPNFFNRVGKSLRIKFAGRATTLAALTTTHAFQVFFGGTTVFTSQFSNTATAQASNPFFGEIVLTCRAIGASANLMGQGIVNGNVGATQVIVGSLSAFPPAAGSNFDATAAQIVDFFGIIQTTGISSLQLHQYSIESLN